jgi:hypothetical protein
MLIRLYRSNLQSLYVPSILVTAEVQPERLSKKYHRKWFFRAGKVQALMRFNEIFDRNGRLDEERVASETLFGVPASDYRGLLTEGARCLSATVRRQESAALKHENQFRYLVGYISERSRQTSGERSRWWISEVWVFAVSLLRRKIRTMFMRAFR